MPRISEYKYETDKGNVFKLRTDADEELSAQIRGSIPSSPLTENMTLRISANSRVFGIQPRFALLARQIGGGAAAIDADPEDNTGCLSNSAYRYKKVPVLTKAKFDTLVSGSPDDAATTKVTVDSINYHVAKLISEEVK